MPPLNTVPLLCHHPLATISCQSHPPTEVRGHYKDANFESVLRELKSCVSHVTLLGSFADMGNVVGSGNNGDGKEHARKRART